MTARTCRRCRRVKPAGLFAGRAKSAMALVCQDCLTPSEVHASRAEREAGFIAGSVLLGTVIGQHWRPAQA